MPNPTINPAWGADLTYTVTNSEYLAVDVRLSELDEEPAQIELTVPSGTVHAIRNPGSWSTVGSQLLSGGGWAGSPVPLGSNWTVNVTAGAAPTDPATIEITNANGLEPSGLLRLVFRGLTGACEVSPGGGTLSIDRLLAAPSIVNPQVTSGLPVRELDAVTIGATVQTTVQANPAPASPLAAAPAILSSWAPELDNPLAVSGFASLGTTANFTAPAAYTNATLGFRLTAAYDLDASGTLQVSEPRTEHVLDVEIETITHGMVLVLDRSGSMTDTLSGSSTSKWNATVQAAHAWLDLFRSFRSGDSHRAGIVTFEHDLCSWTPTPAADITLRNPQNAAAAAAMSPLMGFGDVTVLNLGSEQSCTPIGDAVLEGLEAVQTALSPDAKATLVLLTDGYENSGRATIKLAAGPASTTVAVQRELPAYSFGNDLVGDRLFTIGVGTFVDEDRLNDLPNPAGSKTGPGYYRLTTTVKEILPTFADMLGQVLDAQRVTPAVLTDPSPPPNALYFQVPTGEQRIALLVPWTSATHNLQVAWRLQGTNGAFTALAGTDPAVVGYWRRQFHGVMTVDLTALTGNGTPPATDWRIQHVDAGAVAQPLTDADVLCMVDLLTKAEITFDNSQYFLGDPIRLSCRIFTGGRPVSGATVGVDAARPGEGLGTFLSVNAPLFQKLSAAGAVVVGTRVDVPGIGASAGASGPLTHVPPRGPRRSPDPDPPKGVMFRTLLAAQKMEALPVIVPPQFNLHDDGAHGDGAVDDGEYAHSFTDTLKEGTYTFRFRIEGTLPDGSRFSRLFVRSTWVGVRPDPATTTMVWATATGLPPGTFGQLLTITPKSTAGEYLGPFRADVIELTVAQGTLDGPLVDNLDGSYTQRVLHHRGDTPIVSVSVYGTPLWPTRPGSGGPGGGGGGGGEPGDLDECFRLLCEAIRCFARRRRC